MYYKKIIFSIEPVKPTTRFDVKYIIYSKNEQLHAITK